jgi:hypothetical protein
MRAGWKAFMKAQKMFPWSILVGFQYEFGKDELIIEVPSCLAQLGRLKHGLGEYSCKAMQ